MGLQRCGLLSRCRLSSPKMEYSNLLGIRVRIVLRIVCYFNDTTSTTSTFARIHKKITASVDSAVPPFFCVPFNNPQAFDIPWKHLVWRGLITTPPVSTLLINLISIIILWIQNYSWQSSQMNHYGEPSSSKSDWFISRANDPRDCNTELFQVTPLTNVVVMAVDRTLLVDIIPSSE